VRRKESGTSVDFQDQLGGKKGGELSNWEEFWVVVDCHALEVCQGLSVRVSNFGRIGKGIVPERKRDRGWVGGGGCLWWWGGAAWRRCVEGRKEKVADVTEERLWA